MPASKQNKNPATSASTQHAQPRPAAACVPPRPRRPPCLSDRESGEFTGSRAPSASGSKQNRPGEQAWFGPAKGAQLPPAGAWAGSGRSAEHTRFLALRGDEPGRAAFRSCRSLPDQRLSRGWGNRRLSGAADLANPAAGTREGCELGLAKFPWKLHV